MSLRSRGSRLTASSSPLQPSRSAVWLAVLLGLIAAGLVAGTLIVLPPSTAQVSTPLQPGPIAPPTTTDVPVTGGPVPSATPEPMPGPQTCGAAQWVTPVDAPIADPFRPPSNPYGPGNRGIEYQTATGDRVAATDAGIVIYVGPVGGQWFIVVRHADGLRSTYGYLAAVLVARGDVVGGGASIASAGPGFHLTAREGEQYIDPTPLLAERCFAVRLVPLPPENTRSALPAFGSNATGGG